MSLAAEVTCFCGTGRFDIPAENRELRIAALNHKPVDGILGYDAADLTSKFLKR
jgi:hypothetical protein